MDNYTRATRGAILKGEFSKFYSEARREAYAKRNIGSAFKAIGIWPLNPDAVLTKITGERHVPPSPESIENVTATLSQLKTPRKSTAVLIQTQIAEEAIATGDVDTALTVIWRFDRTAQTALSTAEILVIELAEIRRQYGGKKAAKTDRRVLTRARVIDGAVLMKLRDQREEADHLNADRAAVATAKRKLLASKGSKQTIKVRTVIHSSRE